MYWGKTREELFMLTFIFVLLMAGCFGKMIGVALKAAWGVSKIAAVFVLLPIILIVMVIIGLIKIAIPVLLIIGAVSLFSKK